MKTYTQLIEELVEAASAKSSSASAKSSSAGSDGQGLAARVGDSLQKTVSAYSNLPSSMFGPFGQAVMMTDKIANPSSTNSNLLQQAWADRHNIRAERKANIKANVDRRMKFTMKKSKAKIDAKNAALNATTNIVTGNNGAIRRVAKANTASAPRQVAMIQRGGVNPPQP